MSTQTMIKILFLAANPQDTTRLQIDEEMHAVDQALRMAEYRDHFDLRSHWAVRYGDLQELLLRHQPHIVHFSGHSSPASEIILEGEDGIHPVDPVALSTLFSILKDNLRCVVLNACYSEVQARAIAQYINCVIGMADTIGDTASINFASAFYRALGYGRSIKEAFDLGCNAIDLANLAETDIPQLLALHTDPAQVVLITLDLAAHRDLQDTYAVQESQLASIQNHIDSMIRLQKVEQIDRDWENERKSYMETEIKGATMVDGRQVGGYPVQYLPTKERSVGEGVMSIVGGLIWIVVISFTDFRSFALFGLALIAVGVCSAIASYFKAEKYERAEQEYQRRRAIAQAGEQDKAIRFSNDLHKRE